MFSAISSSTTIAITPVAPVSPVSAPAPAAPVAAPSSSAGDAALGGGFGGGQTTQFTPSGASPHDPNTAAAAAAASASTTAGKAGTAKAAIARIPVTLDAQLMQIENKLADCVNCPSAKTLAGQSQIDALSSQVRQIRQRMLGGDADAAYGVVPPPIGLNLDTCV